MCLLKNCFITMINLFQVRYVKVLVLILSLLFLFTIFGPILMSSEDEYVTASSDIGSIQDSFVFHKYLYEQFYSLRQDLETSNLGGMLFKNEVIRTFNSPKNYTYVVLVWKHWKWLQGRHVHSYGSGRTDPLDSCSVKNCVFTGEDKAIDSADAIIVHLQKGMVPKVKKRNLTQRWIFLDDESPNNAFSLSRDKWKLKHLANVFNWSMTYRAESDIPVPYGRTLPYEEALIPNIKLSDVKKLIPNWKKKRHDVPATVLMSNCGVKARNDFIKELQKYIPVDVYGGCATDKRTKNRCPGHFKSDCDVVSEYLFYLVLENSGCRQYLTEKIFHHAYGKGAIPIIMGPLLEDCEMLLPPSSYLHIERFDNVKDLADTVQKMLNNNDLLLSLHIWRNHFKILNEHGYFGSKSYHLCRVCEALNFNDKRVKTYTEDDLELFLDPFLLCKKLKS